MKKSDFKTFDIATLRNGENYFYYKEVLIPITNPHFPHLYMELYDNELKRTESDLNEEKFDIMRVIRWNDECQIWNHIDDFIDNFLSKNESYANFDIIFQRQEILELTIDDIAKKFNVSPSQIKIKKVMDYKVIFKEVGRKERTTHFYNAKSESQVIEHFGLNDPEIEYYKLEKIT